MPEVLTSVVEVAVGVACLAGAAGSWRRLRWLAVVLAVAGILAVGHGILALVR